MQDSTHTNRTTIETRPGRSRVLWLTGAAIVATLILAACAGAAADGGPDSSQADPSASAASTLPADFQITVYQGEDSVGGQEVNLSEVLARGRPVVLNFWAGLCPPCRLEMPDLQAVHETFGGQVVLFGLDVGPFTALGSNEDGRALVRELGVTYPTGTTSESRVVRDFQVTGMPSTYFIKPNGEVFRKWTGLLTEAKLSELVQELLEAAASS
jgi:thiol-disulfide isomerase/thioredoxin